MSCTKNKNDAPLLPPINKCDQIIEVTFDHPYSNPPTQREATITYDERGRVKTVIGQGQNTATYEYPEDTIIVTETDVFGTPTFQKYFLNRDGFVQSTQTMDYKFTYNADGQLVSYQQPYGDATGILGYTPYTLSYIDGDLVEITTAENVANKQISFTYYDEPNQDIMGYNQPLYIGQVLGGRNTFYLIKSGFFGKQSAHLLKTIDMHQGYPPGMIEYVKDSKGRITKTQGGWGVKYFCP
jgi:hypothetical protein